VFAVLQNLDVWIEDTSKLAETPGEHQRQALHLVRNMMQCRLALKRMMGRVEEQE
jgi:hypothetical protein